ncbi:MAG: dihydroorotate dehydrogenase [Bacteroidales bacterium]|nr:dihydroorotate dehydrogenase [Candidatus Latescibacterota bacterium]
MSTTGSIKVTIGDILFDNPVFLASGPAGYGEEYDGFIDLQRLGGIVTKTVTYEPKAGNPGTRLQETPGGLLNSVGLENVGASVFFGEKLPRLLDRGIRPIVSLAAEDWDGYRKLLDAAADTGMIDIVELNLSCPNVERGGMAVGTDPRMISRYVGHAKDILSGAAIIAKLTPNVQDIGRLALAAEEAGASAITAINTIVGMDIDIRVKKPVFKRKRAGLSGPAIFPVALEAVWRIVNTVDIPVIGVGGIDSVDDALKFFMAGAAAVQVGTAIFYDSHLPEKIVTELEKNGIPASINTEGN